MSSTAGPGRTAGSSSRTEPHWPAPSWAVSALAGYAAAAGEAAPTAVPKIHPKVDGDINFLTFAEYIPPAVVTTFEKKYGVKVHQSFYSTQPEMVTKMATGAPIDLASATRRRTHSCSRAS